MPGPPPRYHPVLRPEDSTLLSLEDVALQLGVSRGRIAELIAAGRIVASADGLVEMAELERCRGAIWVRRRRPDRRPADLDQEEELSRLVVRQKWYNLAILMQPVHDLPPATWRAIYPSLIANMREVGLVPKHGQSSNPD